MTKAKSVAKTLKSTIDNPIIKEIRNRQSNIDPVIDKVQKYWSYDLFSRKPGPAYKDGIFVGTDLDMAAFLYELSDRGAVINIPNYKSMRGKSTTEGQMITSKENRHGKLLGLVSNKDTFIFSLRMKDMNVITTDSAGDYRTFSLTDFDGSWYKGWDKIEFLPSAEENNFIKEMQLSSPSGISFKNFIHPNRWTSFYGKYYFITKLLINRLTEEAAWYNKEIKRILKDGVEYPEVAEPKVWPKKTSSEKKSIKVDAFHVEVDFPDDESVYPFYEVTQEELVRLTAKRKELVYSTIPRLRFMTRATEQAFVKHMDEVGLNKLPVWLENIKWEDGYKLKGKRIEWNRFVLYQPGVGEQAVSIRFRRWKKSERVDIDYK